MSLIKFYNISSGVLTNPLYYAELLDIFDTTVKGILKKSIFCSLLLLDLFLSLFWDRKSKNLENTDSNKEKNM